MFDDFPNNKNIEPPSNLPSEPAGPEDMFANVDSADSDVKPVPNALDAGVLKKKEPSLSPMSPSGLGETLPMYPMRASVLGKVFAPILILSIVGGVGYGAWSLFLKKETVSQEKTQPAAVAPAAETQTTVEQSQPENVVSEEIQSSAAIEEAVSEMTNDQILFGEAVDTDKDGLDDIREVALGADVNNPDSDKDGLTDGDEALIWKTDPLNPDSDGDTYEDGKEVRNGYDPLGPGKLFNVPATSATSS
ncbi:MAG: hypothetical protein PHY40_04630 [Patescibacteria group bacterium]|jgi:hypothetical protein|nr:hypothetical protein [Patescibacteria group bacterium]